MKPLPPCGALCESCIAYKNPCKGCVETRGRPFHLKGKTCPVWECASKRSASHCGACEEFPCELFLGWYDPKRGVVTALRRAGLLALRNRIGDDAWIKWVKEKRIRFGV